MESPAPAVRRLGYQPALAGVRAVAIALVLAHHLTAYFAPKSLGRVASGGFLGVDVFFVLSGFLITTLLLERRTREGTFALRRFYVGRIVRLFPALAVTVVVVSLYLHFTRSADGHEIAKQGFIALFYGANWYATFGHTLNIAYSQTWSLAIEEQFYVIWPLLLLLAVRRLPPRTVATVIAGTIVAVLVWRGILWHRDPSWPRIYERSDTRADSLLVGALCSVGWHNGWIDARRLRWLSLPVLALLLTLAEDTHRDSAFLYYGGFTLVAVASGALIMSLLDGRQLVARVLGARPLVYVGDISYEIYLVHLLVIAMVLRWGPNGLVAQVTVALALTLAAAAALHHGLDNRLRGVRARLRGGSIAGLAQAPQAPQSMPEEARPGGVRASTEPVGR